MGVTVGLSVFIPVGIASAVPPDEAYPPAAVVNLLDPFGSAPDSITGDIGEVLAGSTVSLELVMAGEVMSTATARRMLTVTPTTRSRCHPTGSAPWSSRRPAPTR